MKQSDTEGPSRDPSRVGVIEFGEDVAGAVSAVFRNGKDAYDNGKHTSKCPKDGKRLFSISNVSGRLSEESHIKPRQPAVSKGRYQVTKESDGKEDQIDLPVGTSKNSHIRFRLEDIDACTKKERSGEVDGEGDGDVSDYESPTTDPRSDPAVRRWRKHKGLVVHTTTGWIDACNLTQGSSYTEHNQRYSKPTPNDTNRSCAGDGVVKRRCQTIRNRGKDEGHECDLEC
jgi:hypothetical protein